MWSLGGVERVEAVVEIVRIILIGRCERAPTRTPCSSSPLQVAATQRRSVRSLRRSERSLQIPSPSSLGSRTAGIVPKPLAHPFLNKNMIATSSSLTTSTMSTSSGNGSLVGSVLSAALSLNAVRAAPSIFATNAKVFGAVAIAASGETQTLAGGCGGAFLWAA